MPVFAKIASLRNRVKRFSRKQTQQVTKKKKTKSAPVVRSKRATLIRYGIFAGTGLVLITLVVLAANLTVKYFQASSEVLEDNYSLSLVYPNHRNHLIYILKDDESSGYKFVDDIYLLSMNYVDLTYSVVNVSKSFVVSVPYLDRRYSIDRIYSNAVFMNENPYIAVNSGVTNLLGVSVSGYTFIEKKDLSELKNLFGFSNNAQESANLPLDLKSEANTVNVIKFLYNVGGIVGKLKSTFSKEQLISTIYDLYKFKLIKSIKIDETYGNPDEFSFGKGYHPIYTRIDEEISKILRDHRVLAEQIKVEVFNGTEIPFFAGRISRILNNFGINVVRYSNAPKRQEKTTLYVKEGSKADLNITLIKNLIKPDILVVEGNYEFNATGELVLVLGDDLDPN